MPAGPIFCFDLVKQATLERLFLWSDLESDVDGDNENLVRL